MNAPEQPYAPAGAIQASLYVKGDPGRGLVLDPADAKALGIALVRASVEGEPVRIMLPAAADLRSWLPAAADPRS